MLLIEKKLYQAGEIMERSLLNAKARFQQKYAGKDNRYLALAVQELERNRHAMTPGTLAALELQTLREFIAWRGRGERA